MDNKRNAVISALFEKKNKRKPKNSQELQAFIKSQGGDEFLKKVDEYIDQAEKELTKQAQKALHGAKLNYLKSLKHQCAEDEEVVYYKKGGSVRCGCKKKEEGGEVVKAQDGAVAKFKARKAKSGITLSAVADATGSQGGFRNALLKKKEEEKKPSSTQQPKKEIKEGWDKHGNYIVSKKGMNEREKLLNANKNEEGKADPNKKMQQKKKCGGKVKKNEDGSKIKKNCNGAVAKFKMHRQGGSLNGIPFYLKGTVRDGIYGLIDNAKNFIKGITGDLTPLRYLNDPNTYTQGGFYKYLYNPLLKKWTILRGMHGVSDNKYTKGRNTSIKTISGDNLFFTPVNSTFTSYNDGTTEFRNDGTVYYKGNKI